MVAVFGAFALSDTVFLKLLGLVDRLIPRAALEPA
jgi:hypothetical protein